MMIRLGGAAGALEIARRNAAKAKAAAPPAVVPPEQLTLPFWPEGQRALPNEIVRSALFSARNRNQPRAVLQDAPIAAIGDIQINFTGQELRQDDATVMYHLVHLAREQGCNIKFSPRSFCQAVGWGPDGKSYVRLRRILTRLQATALSVCSSRLGVGVSLSLLPVFRWRDANGPLALYEANLSSDLIKLFGGDHYTRVEWAQRLALPDGLATWLHGFFASHRDPFPVRLEVIREAAGLVVTTRHHLRATVVDALTQLRGVDFLQKWEIRGDSVFVVRAPSTPLGRRVLGDDF